jgi:glycine cleavage system aminomethyltransferase T
MSLAKGARNRGVRMEEGVEVTGVITERGSNGGSGGSGRSAGSGERVVGVRTLHNGVAGEVRCETLVNCAGQWARQFGALAGVTVPLFPAEHFYIVTDRIEGVFPMLPVMRDPDGFIYYKEEVGGLLMGGFEPVAKPWRVDPIPSSFQFQLLDEDWEQFEPLMKNAIHRTPCLETAKVKMLLNGPESFTPDGNFILGEAPELRNYFVCAGFNSAGIANSGGAGRLMAEWIQGGQAPSDLWDVDIRRFGPFMANRKLLAERTAETLGLHYAMRWPRQELESARPLRTSPLYDLLLAKNAEFGSRNGWERANYFKPAGAKRPEFGLGRPGWLDWVIEEQRATREAVALYDQSSFGKLLLQGRDALAVLQRLCANEMDVAVGRMVYTAVLNQRAGFESDLTVMRLGVDQFLLITGSAQPVRDADWIRRHIGPDQFAVLTDVSPLWSVLSVMGPRAPELLARLSPDDVSPAGLKFAHTREIDLSHARVRAARMSYVGGPGYELYVPVEMARHVYLALHEAGKDLGLRDAGYYAIDALRIEAGRRAWGAELGPDETPLQAGLVVGVKLDKPADFIGRNALHAAQLDAKPLDKKLLTFVFDDPSVYAWGGETVLLNGQAVGELSSVGWGYKAGACVALGYARGAAAGLLHQGTTVAIDLWGEPVAARAYERWPA